MANTNPQDGAVQERFLLNALAAIQAGDASQTHAVCAVLRKAKITSPEVAQILVSMVTLNHPDLQIHALAVLPSFPEVVEKNAVTIRSLMGESSMVAASAATALAFGNGPQSAAAISAAIIDPDMAGLPLSYLVSALGRSPEKSAQFIEELERLEARLATKEPDFGFHDLNFDLSITLSRARQHLQYQHQQAFQLASSEESIPLCRFEGANNVDPSTQFAPYRRELTPLKVGVMADEYLRFAVPADCRCRVSIIAGTSGRVFVVLGRDGKSYGMTQTNVFEYLATMVEAIYGLKERELVFIDRQYRSSGSEPSANIVTMDRLNASYRNPTWTAIKDVTKFFRDEGVEL